MASATGAAEGATAAAAVPTAAEEVAGLDRVLTRLALTDDDKLEKVLQKLIPAVVGQLKSPHEATRKKVLEILSHVNKRLKGLPAMQLPLGELLGMYTGDPPPGTAAAAYGMVRNFALVYAEMAAERAVGLERVAAVPTLLSGLSRRPAAHQAILLRITAAALEHHPQPPVGGAIPGLPPPPMPNTTAAALEAAPAPGGGGGGDGAARAEDGSPAGPMSAAEAALRARFPFLVDPADRDIFLSYALKLLLYSPRTARAPSTPLAAGQAAAATGGNAAAAAAAAAPPPPGLSVADVRQLEEKGAPSQDQVSRRKLGLLNLLAAAGLGSVSGSSASPLLPATGVLPHLLVAAVDPNEPVARRAEELLKRSAALDPNRPAADPDSEDLIRRLLTLFHGGGVRLFYDQPSPAAGAAAAAGDQVASPVGPALRSRLVAVFCRSVTFANIFPASLLTIQECVMPPQIQTASTTGGGGVAVATVAAGGGGGGGASLSGVFARLRQQGLELCVWVFKHAGRHQLKAMGPVVLQGLLDTLDATAVSPGSPMDSGTMTLRGFAYQAVGSLAQRIPELLQPRTDIARRFFTALADEPPGVRAAVQEATSALSRAFVLHGNSGHVGSSGTSSRASPALSRQVSGAHLGGDPAAGGGGGGGGEASAASAASAAVMSYDGYAGELDELLLESVTSHKDAVRLCAVQWACRLFPFNHVPARWICILAAGDAKHDIREEATRGLKPPTSQRPPGAGMGTGLSAAEVSGPSSSPAGPLPSLFSVLRYIRQRLPRFRRPADPLAPLPLPPRSCLALIALLRACRTTPPRSADEAAAATLQTDGAVVGGLASAASESMMDVDAPTGAERGEGGGDNDKEAEAGGDPDPDPELRTADPGSVLAAYACALEAGLCRVEGSSEVAAAALEALLEAAAEDGTGSLARRYAPRCGWLRGFLSHTDPWARLAAAKLLGSHVAAVMEPQAAQDLLAGLCATLSPLLGGRDKDRGKATAAGSVGAPAGKPEEAQAAAAAAPSTTPTSASSAPAASAAGTGSLKVEEAEGCLLAVGLLLGQAALHPGSPSLDPAAAAAAVHTLTAILGAANPPAAAATPTAPAALPYLRATAALALSYACVDGPRPALLAPVATEAVEAGAEAAAAAAAAKPEGPVDGAAPEGMDVDTAGTSAPAPAPQAAASGEKEKEQQQPEAESIVEPAAAADVAAAPAVGAGDAPTPAPAAAAALPPSPSLAPQRILDVAVLRILDLLADKDAKVATRAAAAAGFLAGGWAGAWVGGGDGAGLDPRVSDPLLDGLFAMASNKSEDVQFAAGEALAWAFGGLSVSRARVLRANFTTLADLLTASQAPTNGDDAAAAAAAAGEAGAAGGSAPAAAPAPAAAEASAEVATLRSRVLDRLLGDLVVSPKSDVRCAGAVWLVSLLGFCGGASALRGPALPRIQESLSGLLGDSNELTQEMASRGVSLVYSLGDAKIREQLVSGLVVVLGGGSAAGGGAGRPVKLTADTQVFEEGTLGSAPGGGGGSGGSGGGSGGGLSTYKELCALATDLGQPDLIYKFMDLAHHAAALNSRRGAAFGFAGIARLAARGGGAPGAALARHLAVLVPKLYRYTHDPNPKVAESMVAIWRSLVDDPRATLDKHFGPIMMDLLKEIGGRLWRNRQAACAAMADLLQGRRWPELSPYFAQLWTMLFRAMDDIKDSVRRAALSLARTVRGLTLRMVDPAHTPARECSAAVAALLPILLEKGLPSTVTEIRGLSVEVLGLAAKSAPPAALRPLLPTLVPALLEALSSLEDVRLNYVEQHAERLGLDSERLEGARVAAARASPLGDTLDLAARLADGPSLEALIPALVGTVKRGVGLNTKAGTARFIRNLASRPGALTGGSTGGEGSASAGGGGGGEPLLRPHVGPVLRVLTSAVRSERSGTVRRAYAAAAAQVVRHASEKRLEKFVVEALAMYTDLGADVDSRLTGGLLLRELLRAAPEKLRPYDVAVLPTAFGAKMDEDKEVAAVWAELWEEGVSSEPAALRLYGKEICTTLCEMLGGQQWGRKKAAAEATVKLTQTAPDALGEEGRRLAGALMSELAVGRLWEGKESLLKALAALVAADPRVMEAAPGHGAVVEALMAAVGRKKASYRTAALTALEVVLRAVPGSHYDKVSPPLLAAVTKHCEAGPTTTASASGPNSASTSAPAADEEPEKPLPLAESLTCLTAAFARVGGGEGAGRGGGGGGGAEAAVQAADAVSGSGSGSVSGSADASVLAAGEGLSATVRSVLGAQLPWQAKLAAAGAAQTLAQRCSALRLPSASAATLCGPLALGLLQSAHDHKIQQLRLAALEALAAITQAAAPPPPAEGPVGWGDAERRDLLPGLVSGLQQLAEADKAAAVAAAALSVKAALEPHLLLLPAAAVTDGEKERGGMGGDGEPKPMEE